MYALEGIPSIIDPEDVQRALAALKQDRSATGRRDYAIWMLLTTYGLRGGEIKALQLPDIDWRHEQGAHPARQNRRMSDSTAAAKARQCTARLLAPWTAGDDLANGVPAGPSSIPAARHQHAFARCREPAGLVATVGVVPAMQAWHTRVAPRSSG